MPRISRIPTCHPSRKHEAFGLCLSCYQKEHTNKKPSRHAKRSIYGRRSNLKKFGLTEDTWEKLYTKQGGKCPICSCQLYRFGEADRAGRIDHDHKTGRVRGLVCHQCNVTKIGSNTVESLKMVIKYMESDFDGRALL